MELSLKQDIGGSPVSFPKFLESQRELFYSQVDQLQDVVIRQCRLTGVNPLSQEMAAGALSIKIGKRPRDLLNPKAVKYMQSIFSIKDDISKKECREISARFGVTVTQVRDFFASQRTRVRRFVRLSREKVVPPKASEEALKNAPIESVSVVPADPVPLSSIAPRSVDEAQSSSTQSDTLTNISELDKRFVDSIFCLMGKEETFAGQVKLLKWVQQIQNTAVISWFLTKGGVMIIATWLNQAAVEEQTSVILVILEVLSHLPLHKAEPAHLSAILQNINRLRFYQTSDVSNRAKALLAKWSKMLARTQGFKQPNGVTACDAAQNESFWKQGFSEMIGDETWQSNLNMPEGLLASYEDSEKPRKLEAASQPLKLLPSPSDDLNRKHVLSLSSNHNKERRKVMLVEQPGQKMPNRNPQVSRAAAPSQSRPVTVDDIKKAKMRAFFMQSKYAKGGPPPHGNKIAKTESPLRTSVTETSNSPPLSKIQAQHNVEEEKTTIAAAPKSPEPIEIQGKVEDENNTILGAPSKTPEPKVQAQSVVEDEKSSVVAPSKIPDALIVAYSKPKIELKRNFLEECKRIKIPWRTPPEVRLHEPWGVGSGEDSKEVEVQRNRTRREMETFYRTVQEIPLNSKEPWDREMDYDDSLTPVIPLEQLPDAVETQTTISGHTNNHNISLPSSSTTSQTSNSGSAEPDLELLAMLLKNPELVMALTSGQAGNLPNAETMKLLDTIKSGSSGGPDLITAVVGREERVEVSLPSPTPPLIDPGMNPFSQQRATGNRATTGYAPPQAAVASSNIGTALKQQQQQYNESVTTVPPNPNYAFHQQPTMTGPQHIMRQHHHLQQQLYAEPSFQNSSYYASSSSSSSSSWSSNHQAQTVHQTSNYNGGQLVRDNHYHHHHHHNVNRGQGYDSRASENSPTRPGGYVQGRNQQPQGQHPTNQGQFHGYRDNSGWRRDRRY